MSGSGSDVLATEEGGRRLCRDVRRGLGTRRKHKNANEMSRRLRKSEEKVGKSLTVAKTRHSGELLSAWIAAAKIGGSCVADGAR